MNKMLIALSVIDKVDATQLFEKHDKFSIFLGFAYLYSNKIQTVIHKRILIMFFCGHLSTNHYLLTISPL